MISKALVAASTKPLILSILMDGESYGYQIIQRVKKLSGGKIEWSDGMLYPVLHRLEKNNLISSSWKMSAGGRHRKYYTIEPKGKEALDQDMQEWMSVHSVLSELWHPLYRRQFQPE
jgi:DNA-binding PadR family transcriptional regulator